ncbi:MAG: polyphosphate kinase 1, partial [Nitrospirae bacterium]|nr:polyphosphate kinase 1 [Nitrospirota bacterium]
MTVTETKKPAASKTGVKAVNLNHRTYYFNRELSWLQFNERVLQQALDERHPLLERLKFLAIFASNLDEFFMLRVSGLRRQLEGGALEAPPDGMSPGEQLKAIRSELEPALDRAEECCNGDLVTKLRKVGVHVLAYEELKSKQKKMLRKHFKQEIFPVLTPLAFDPGHPFPHISNLSLNLAVVISDPGRGEKFARVKVPHMFPRFVQVPCEDKAERYEELGLVITESTNFVLLEDVIAANLDTLFPGMEIEAAYPFRVTRDADVEIEEDEASDLLSAMEVVVGQRHFGSVVRLELDARMPTRVRDILVDNLGLAPYQVYAANGPLGHADLWDLTKLDLPDLKDPPFKPAEPKDLRGEESIFSILKRRSVLLYHPYDSFRPVVDFVRAAAADTDVLAIKQTLYRVGPNSPIVQALRQARENGKQVSVLVELKARFDEENNIVWARSLEKAGVHVVYGLVGLKTHAKMCLVVRRESDGLKRYVHLGTGNYNPVTARVYTDLGYLTTDPEIAADVSHLFNALTGYSREDDYRKLLVAPGRMRQQILERIEREIACHRQDGNGHLVFKINALVDKACIRGLYEASIAGVRVDLQVRGICCLRPGVKRVSENITVTSIVGRFLEHSRIFYFRNGGEEEILLGSADLMPRNLSGRVETLFPVEDERLKSALRDEILELHLRDNVQSYRLMSDGSYV